MANLNKVLLIGRLMRDPEMVTFANGGRVAKFGFAVNNRKKNQSTGQWEEDPVFLDVEAFNRETGRKLADLVEQYLKKGHQVYLECSMKLDTWNDKTTGDKRQKLKFVVNDLQLLEPKSDGGNAEGGSRTARAARPLRCVGRRAVPAAERRPLTTTKNPNHWTRRRAAVARKKTSRSEERVCNLPFKRQVTTCPRRNREAKVMATKAKPKEARPGAQGSARRHAAGADRERGQPRQTGRRGRSAAGLRPQLPRAAASPRCRRRITCGCWSVSRFA